MANEDSSWASMPLSIFHVSCAALTTGAKQLVLNQISRLRHGSLIIHDVDGSKHKFGESATAATVPGADASSTAHPSSKERELDVHLDIHSSFAWTRILLGNDIGFAEAYMLGELSCNDLTGFFLLFILNSDTSSSTSAIASRFMGIMTASWRHLSNTSEQALLNAQNHYSLSNDMFAAFLDPTMTYSAPIWLPISSPDAATDTLEKAQLRKLHYTIAAARIQANDHVLEIGTGWGSFAIEAVRKTGCRVTTITASSEQASLTIERIREAGLDHAIEVLVCDYRQVPLPNNRSGKYDKIVSIEMIEHVGAAYLDVYFKCIDRYLKVDGGIAVFQCITIPEGRYKGYKGRSDFIQRYIFPGGHLPTVSGMVASIDRGSAGRLVVEDIKSVSGQYVRALREWREKFLDIPEQTLETALRKTKSKISVTDIEVFRRKWEYYFCYCEAGFATKTLGDVSITVGREGAMDLIGDIPM